MNVTVRARLLRLAILLLLPGLAIAILLTWQVFLTARAGAETALRASAHGLDQLVDREFSQAELLLRTLAATADLRRGDMAGLDELARATVIMGGKIVLTDQTGQELIDTAMAPKTAALPKSAAPPDWATETVGIPTIQPLTQQAGSRLFSARVVLPVGMAGRHAYDLALVVPATFFQAILVRAALPPGWTSSVMDTAGQIAARAPDPERFIGVQAGPEVLAGLAMSDEGTRDAISSDGTSVLLAHSRSHESRWTVAVAAPRRLVAKAGLHSTKLLAALGTLTILAAVLAARQVAQQISRPVRALAQAARALGEGESWPPIPRGLAETDAVARALAIAARQLAERQEALTELNATLVARVDARTRALADANLAIEEQRCILAAILDEMPVGVLVHLADRTLSLANLEARRLLHIPPGQTRQLAWPVMRQAGQLLTADATPTAYACAGVLTERTLLSVTSPTGRPTDLEVSASPLRDAQGRVTSAVTILQDVSARLAADEGRRRSQRLEAVGQLTGGVAHEFNNLLMAVSGCLELLQKPVAAMRDARASSLLANAASATDRGSRLTSQLLAFARRQTLQLEPLDLDRVVIGLQELLESTLGRGVQVCVVPGAAEWPAMADTAQVELMLMNLAINARDAMPGGGTLTIRTECVRTGPPLHAEDPPAGEHAVLHLTDTGQGMSAHVLARVFEPFFTTKDVGAGPGLGLPQVLGVAQQMGGGVTIASQPGAGTTVSVFLPRARLPAAWRPDDAPLPSRAARTLGGARLLLVDDDIDVRTVTRAILEDMDAQVIEAPSGAAALLALRTTRVDLVLADLTMPCMTGIELAREVAVFAPGLPVVLMTGYGPGASANQGPHIRATLQKPFRATVLAQTLADALDLDVATVPGLSR